MLALSALLAGGARAGEAPGGDSASQRAGAGGLNLALVARSSTSFVSGHETITALNDGFTPENSNDKSHGAYGNWPRSGTQWVQYEWSQPISTRSMEVYWFDDDRGVRLPRACRVLYWDGQGFVPAPGANGPALEKDRFNRATFSEVTTSRLRLELDSNGAFSTGLLEWRVYDSGKSPNFPPMVSAGVDRSVVLPAPTWLSGAVRDDGKVLPSPVVTWGKLSGPAPWRLRVQASPKARRVFPSPAFTCSRSKRTTGNSPPPTPST